jgi:epoxyqueuosine reductase
MQADKKIVSAQIKQKAGELGFDLAGIAMSERLVGHEERINQWCAAGMNGSMGYLSRDIVKRTDPGLLLPGARSVIVTGLNYYTENKFDNNGTPVISRYAYGDNYHDVILEKLNVLLDHIKLLIPGAHGKTFVDSAPILEKAWACRAGLGWPGKHSVLINRKIGSFFFLGVLLTDVELEYNEAVSEDYCGTCRLCIDACPTAAINDNRTIDVRKCIAYQTIEQKEPVDAIVSKKSEGRVFGCDICQDACPWNRHARHHSTPEFEPSDELLKMTSQSWQNLTREDFKRMFRRSAIGRKKYETFVQNVTNVTKI